LIKSNCMVKDVKSHDFDVKQFPFYSSFTLGLG